MPVHGANQPKLRWSLESKLEKREQAKNRHEDQCFLQADQNYPVHFISQNLPELRGKVMSAFVRLFDFHPNRFT